MNEAEPKFDLGWPDIAAILFASKGITEGLWRISVKMRFTALTVHWQVDGAPSNGTPTGMVGVEGLALFQASEPGPMVFDAAILTAGLPTARHASKKRARNTLPSK